MDFMLLTSSMATESHATTIVLWQDRWRRWPNQIKHKSLKCDASQQRLPQ
jgi:hypothetical protein